MGTRNPMRWDCTTKGCFNTKKRPKIEEFAECFPRRIAMGDVDGMVELNGHFLFIEWKPVREISIGQSIAFKALTQPEVTPDCRIVFVVAGDAETMKVDAVLKFQNGKQGEWHATSLDELKEAIKTWARVVEKRPRPQAQNCAAITKGGG